MSYDAWNTLLNARPLSAETMILGHKLRSPQANAPVR